MTTEGLSNSAAPEVSTSKGVATLGRGRTVSGSDDYSTNIQELNELVQKSSTWVRPMEQEISQVVVAQSHLITRLIIGLLSNGHILLEGVPGLAKTLALKSLAETMDTGFKRIQFTPDMLPADIIGTQIYNPEDLSFVVKKGPVFTNLVLADEINRAPAKVQSALLEAMQERRVTIGDTTYDLPEPFIVLATQNPIEQEGTYPLPEAQIDRFMLKVVVGHPTPAEERIIIDVASLDKRTKTLQPVISEQDLVSSREVVKKIYIDDKVKDYIVSLVHATREPNHYQLGIDSYILNGASPRATLSLVRTSQAHAFLEGRGYVTPQDVKSLALDVLRHRISLTYEAEAEALTSEDLVRKILDTVPVP